MGAVCGAAEAEADAGDGAELCRLIGSDARFEARRFAHGGVTVEYVARVSMGGAGSCAGSGPERIATTLDDVSVGQVVWHAAYYFAEWLTSACGVDAVRGRTVLELGSGVGLCGAVAAANASRVVLSDLDPVSLALCGAARAVPAGAAAPCRVVPLAWDCEHDEAAAVAANAGQRFDVVIGCDLWYAPARSFVPCLRSAGRLLRPGGTLLICGPVRHNFVEDYIDETLQKEGWSQDGESQLLQRTGDHAGWHDVPELPFIVLLRSLHCSPRPAA